MRFDVMTLFPGMFDGFRQTQIWKRAEAGGLVSCDFHDPRDFSRDVHRTVDDTPYGGGAGMLLKIEPLVDCLEAIPRVGKSKVLLTSPQGKTLNHPKLLELASWDQLIIVCGRYEGVDERFIEGWVDESFSIGDYVLAGGELPAMVLMEAATRLIPGVLGNQESVDQDSFSSGFLKYPQYTRPVDFRGRQVPEVLRSGHHELIKRWRDEQALERTSRLRPDLLGDKQSEPHKKR